MEIKKCWAIFECFLPICHNQFCQSHWSSIKTRPSFAYLALHWTRVTNDQLTKDTMVMRMTSDTRVRRVRWVKRMTKDTPVMRVTGGGRVIRVTGVTE